MIAQVAGEAAAGQGTGKGSLQGPGEVYLPNTPNGNVFFLSF